MNRITRVVLPALMVTAAAGCSIVTKPGASFPPDSSARPYTETPTRFNADLTDKSGVCQKTIVDPATKAQLKLVRWLNGRGDYEVSVGQYGARANEYLRVDCMSYMPIGLVMKRST